MPREFIYFLNFVTRTLSKIVKIPKQNTEKEQQQGNVLNLNNKAINPCG